MAKLYRQPSTSHKPLRSVWYSIPFAAHEQDVEVVTIYTGKIRKNGFKVRKSGKFYSRKSRR
jgi:hypothetical protein